MNTFKVGDIIRHNIGWEAKILRVDSDSFRITLTKPYKYLKPGYISIFPKFDSNYLTKVEDSLELKQEKLIRKIQYLYEKSPSSFEKRWVKK